MFGHVCKLSDHVVVHRFHVPGVMVCFFVAMVAIMESTVIIAIVAMVTCVDMPASHQVMLKCLSAWPPCSRCD